MKEFIEKLISRLEEYKYTHLTEHDSKECLYCQEHEYDWCDGRNCLVCAFEKSEKIVNELAEEYKKKKLSRMATTDYIVDKEYCWQKCSAIEMCNECARLKNGTVDYFENYDSLVDEYNNGWIPCSERLPSVGVTVLCYWKKYDRYDNTTSYYYSLMHRNENCQWLSDLGMCNGEVIAWQPLPQPYKEGSENNA